MPNTPAGMRECPTRADGTTALFAHVIDAATCQQRQRQHYHKCPTCSFCNARIGLAPTPTNGHPVAGAGRLPPLEPPMRKPAAQAQPATNGHAAAESPARPAHSPAR